jgi:hypothetical protein
MSTPTLGPTMRYTPSRPLPVSEVEAKHYYAGLHSRTILIARTGLNPWEAPSGPEEYLRLKELRILGAHKIEHVWEDDLVLKVHAILDDKEIDWSSTDVVRIGYVDEPSGDAVLWIGVRPESVSYEVAIDAALQCKRLLLAHSIEDVEVELHQAEIISLANPQLYQPVFSSDPTADVLHPFSSTIGITICAQSTPWAEGTGGFFLAEGGDGTRLFVVTVRHVVLPRSENDLFEHKSESQPRHNVLLLSEASFKEHLASVDKKIEEQEVLIDFHTRRFQKMDGREDSVAVKEREDAQEEVKKAGDKKEALRDFHLELEENWATESSRILGHVIFSPPIVPSADTEHYTQDIAVIEIDTSKIDPSHFRGNVIDLGTKFSPETLTAMMHPNPENSDNFEFPTDRLLSVQGIIKGEELRKPTVYDENGNRCIMVLKRGRTTGLTVGRANNIMSYTRRHFRDQTSKQWAILPFDQKSGPFSDKGDSGSIVVDGAGRIGGIITGAGGLGDSCDVTYATPIEFVMKVIRSNKSLVNAYPTPGPSA